MDLTSLNPKTERCVLPAADTCPATATPSCPAHAALAAVCGWLWTRVTQQHRITLTFLPVQAPFGKSNWNATLRFSLAVKFFFF